LGAVFTSSKIANNEDQVRRFLRAYVRGAQDYHDAFTNTDERREDQATAPAVLDLIATAIGQTPAQVRTAVPYMDRQARVDVGDVLHQIAWFKSQGMLKDNVDGNAIIDKRYVVPMPKK
jgi:hypothetical protein